MVSVRMFSFPLGPGWQLPFQTSESGVHIPHWWPTLRERKPWLQPTDTLVKIISWGHQGAQQHQHQIRVPARRPHFNKEATFDLQMQHFDILQKQFQQEPPMTFPSAVLWAYLWGVQDLEWASARGNMRNGKSDGSTPKLGNIGGGARNHRGVCNTRTGINRVQRPEWTGCNIENGLTIVGGSKKPMNMNNFAGLSRKWVGVKLFMCFPFLGKQGNT